MNLFVFCPIWMALFAPSPPPSPLTTFCQLVVDIVCWQWRLLYARTVSLLTTTLTILNGTFDIHPSEVHEASQTTSFAPSKRLSVTGTPKHRNILIRICVRCDSDTETHISAAGRTRKNNPINRFSDCDTYTRNAHFQHFPCVCGYYFCCICCTFHFLQFFLYFRRRRRMRAYMHAPNGFTLEHR